MHINSPIAGFPLMLVLSREVKSCQAELWEKKLHSESLPSREEEKQYSSQIAAQILEHWATQAAIPSRASLQLSIPNIVRAL